MTNNDYLKKIDLEIMERLLMKLYGAGSSKKTTIARDTRMSYNRCVQYLNCLLILDFVKRQKEGDHIVFGLTQNGIDFCKRKLGTDFSIKYEKSTIR